MNMKGFVVALIQMIQKECGESLRGSGLRVVVDLLGPTADSNRRRLTQGRASETCLQASRSGMAFETVTGFGGIGSLFMIDALPFLAVPFRFFVPARSVGYSEHSPGDCRHVRGHSNRWQTIPGFRR